MHILLIIVGLALIVINYIPIKKNTNSFGEILKDQDNLDKDYDVELMAIRRDMAESILDLQKEIEHLRNDIKHIINDVNISDKNQDIVKDNNDIEEERKEDHDIVCDIDFNRKQIDTISNKADIIRKMISEGYSDDDICKELKIGKGEVLLIKGLYK